jgi:hypothetical protein
MRKEEMQIYADKYRKTMKKLSIGLSKFIFIIAAILFSVAIIIFLYGNCKIMSILGGIMATPGAVDILGGIKLISYSKKKFTNMKDLDCSIHYCKIHGFDSKME